MLNASYNAENTSHTCICIVNLTLRLEEKRCVKPNAYICISLERYIALEKKHVFHLDHFKIMISKISEFTSYMYAFR